MRIYYSVSDIEAMFDVSKSKAYEIIRVLNEELKEKGYLVISGKVSVAYFHKRWYGLDQAEKTT